MGSRGQLFVMMENFWVLMCVRASYTKMTRDTNLMQQFIIINKSSCFGHLYAHLQEYQVVYVVYYSIWCSALGVVAEVLRSRCVVLCTGVSFYPTGLWVFCFILLFCVLLYVNVHCTTVTLVTTQLQLTNMSHHVIHMADTSNRTDNKATYF